MTAGICHSLGKDAPMGRIFKNTIVGLTAVGVLVAGIYALFEACDHVKEEKSDPEGRFDPWHYR